MIHDGFSIPKTRRTARVTFSKLLTGIRPGGINRLVVIG
jgi:hypothetical protein